MKNKFALCFRPLGIEAEEISDINASSKGINVAKVRKKNGTTAPSTTTSVLKNSGAGSSVEFLGFDRPKNQSRKALSRVLKTILPESSPPRVSVQGRKIPEITLQERTNDSEKRKIHLEKVEDHERKMNANLISEENETIPSNISSSPPPPSSFSNGMYSSVSLEQSSKDFKARSRCNPLFAKKKKAKIFTDTYVDKAFNICLLSSSSGHEDRDMVLYWTVLGLLSTILWGKMLAILLATLWLYFIPCRITTGHLHWHTPPENSYIKLPAEIVETSTNTREYNKKVIMEGLLERRSSSAAAAAAAAIAAEH